MSHFFGHLSSLLEALAKVMRSWDKALCSPLGDAEHPWSTAAPDAGEGDPLAPVILQHTIFAVGAEETFRTSSLLAHASIGGSSPLPYSSI